MNSKKRLAAFIAIISLVFSAMTLATPPAAHAVGCYGDWCSGQDADATGCSAEPSPPKSTTTRNSPCMLGGRQPARQTGLAFSCIAQAGSSALVADI